LKSRYVSHHELEIPSGETKIWRYLDFVKFVSLLDKKALFFCRADMLGDPFEGSFSKANVRLRPMVYKGDSEIDLKQYSLTLKEIPRFTIINCWNISPHESAALWSLYSRTGQGIAIQSTVNRLEQCFGSERSQSGFIEPGIFIGKVKYVDYNNEEIPEGYLINPFFYKRKSFEHEKELRAIIMRYPTKRRGVNFIKSPDVFTRGEYLDIDLETLVEKVYVSPMSPDWFKSLVESVMKKYGIDKKTAVSDLDDSPTF